MARRRCLLYGATGYTGRLLARAAAARGLDLILSGRAPGRLGRLTGELGLEHRAARLDMPREIDRALDGVDVVLNAAGPFAITAPPMASACLRAGVHYLDLTGEVDVLRALRRRDRTARERGVMLLPAAGFIVVPSDGLVVHLAERLPGATRLEMGVSRASSASRGSLRTMIGMIRDGVLVRRGGKLVSLPLSTLARDFDFGGEFGGRRSCLAVNWADVTTAYWTTGIPEITCCLDLAPWERAMFLASRYNAWWLSAPPWRAMLETQSRLLPDGPDDRQRAAERRVIVARAEDAAGRRVEGRLVTPESYDFTVTVALAIVERVLAGETRPGFQTPGRVYGPDFVLGFEGVSRVDLPGRRPGQADSSRGWRAAR